MIIIIINITSVYGTVACIFDTVRADVGSLEEVDRSGVVTSEARPGSCRWPSFAYRELPQFLLFRSFISNLSV